METAMIRVAAPASEEDENHDASEAGGDNGFADDVADGGSNEEGLIGERRNFQRSRQGFCDIGKEVFDVLDDIERGGVALFQNGEQTAALPVEANDVGLGRETVGDRRDRRGCRW